MEVSHSPLQIHRNWLDLPRDVTLKILEKLDVFDKLKSAQFVCKIWYILCKEPSVWRTLRIRGLKVPEMKCYFGDEEQEGEMNRASGNDDVEENSVVKMMYNAIDRSNGGLIKLQIDGFCPPALFSYALSRSSQLKYLRLARLGSILFIVKELKELEKLTSLEQLVLSFSSLPSPMEGNIIPVISSCRFLKSFGLNKQCSYEPACDEEALAIAAAMPNLRRLQLLGNNMTNVGLTAILDCCPLLQSLDLRNCFKLDLAGNLRKRLLDTIKDLRLPELNYNNYYVNVPYVDTVSGRDDDISYQNDLYGYYFC